MSTENAPESRKKSSGKRPVPLKVKLCAFGFAFLLMAIVLEVGARIVVGMNLAQLRQVETEEKKLGFVGDINEVTGVWHFPNATVEVQAPDGPVTYTTNSHGMRDRPREKESAAS